MYIPFLGDISPETSYEGLSVPQAMIIQHLVAIHTAIETVENLSTPKPVYMGHNFESPYAAIADNTYTQDLENHLRAGAIRPEELVRPEPLYPSPEIREISAAPIIHTILDDEVMVLSDAAIDRMNSEPEMVPTSAVSGLSQNTVTDLNMYRNDLDAEAIRLRVQGSSILGEEARAHLAEAA